MKVNYKNKLIDVEIIGSFNINKNEYIVCAYNEETEDKIIILQVERNNGNLSIKDIPNNEKAVVMSTYKEIERKLLNDIYE